MANRCFTVRKNDPKERSLDVSRYRRPTIEGPPDHFSYSLSTHSGNKDKKKQLSWMSRGKVLRKSPGSTVFEDGVEDREQLAHAGHQGHLLRFAGRQKTLVEFLHYPVATRGDQGAHIQRRSDLGPPTPHATLAAQGARVALEWSDPNQGGHSLVPERAQLGHSGQQGAGHYRTHSGHAPQERLVLAQGWAAFDGRLQVALCAGELLLEPPYVGLDAFGHRLGCRGEAVVLGGYHP